VDHGRFHDLLESIDVLELGIWVSLGVLVVDARDLGEVFVFGSVPVGCQSVNAVTKTWSVDVLLHIFPASVSKHLCCSWSIRDTTSCLHHLSAGTSWVGSILEVALQTSWIHLLETNNHYTVSASVANDIAGEVQACRASRAVIINIIDWDLGHAELVEHSLPAGGVSVAIAGDSLVDIVVGDLGVQQSLNASFKAKFCVIDLSSRLDKFGHAHAEDVAWLIALDDHVGGCGGMRG